MKSKKEIVVMLAKANEKKKEWYDIWNSREMGTSQNAECLRNYTALRGVVKTLKWVLDEVHTPLE
tara:strand:- start:25186 stop:25380 length:195 start_codon:yes stop_codon:yes gene_type:complete